MAISGEFRLKGVEALQRRLLQKKENLMKTLDMRLAQLAAEAVTYSKEHKGYKDRSSNLKNSISFALFYDGELIKMHIGKLEKPDMSEGGQAQVKSNLEAYANQPDVVRPKGYTLIIVAGMNYGAHVEHKGYNVLYLTRHYLRKEMKKILDGIVK